MDAVLKEGEFDIDGFVFGGSGLGPIFVDSYDPGVAEWSDQDNVDYKGNTLFGRDSLNGPTWGFVFNVVAETEDTAAALQALELISLKWRALEKRKPGEVSVLRYRRGGRTRRIYGRPRRFSFSPDALLKRGVVKVLADFKSKDAWFYDDELHYEQLKLRSSSTGGGFILPATLPVITDEPSDIQGAIFVGGTKETDMTLTFNGPVIDPGASGAGWSVDLDTELLAGQSVTIDSKEKTVLRNDGASLSTKLGPKTRLSTLKLKPGNTFFSFRGVDLTGQATAELRWRTANTAL